MSGWITSLPIAKQFVESGEYEKYFADKYPERGLAVLSCMDARIIGLLPTRWVWKRRCVSVYKIVRRVGYAPVVFGDAEPFGRRVWTEGQRDCGHRPSRLWYAEGWMPKHSSGASVVPDSADRIKRTLRCLRYRPRRLAVSVSTTSKTACAIR